MEQEPKIKLEIWMQGQIDGITPLLQPVAHTFLQIDADIQTLLTDDLEPFIWVRPFDMANIAFHVQHITGVTKRMIIYSKGEVLSDDELAEIKTEGVRPGGLNIDILKRQLHFQIQQSIDYLRNIEAQELIQERFLGRKKIPTTKIGLLFHAAEHGQRHYGQLLVTIKTVKGLFLHGKNPSDPKSNPNI